MATWVIPLPPSEVKTLKCLCVMAGTFMNYLEIERFYLLCVPAFIKLARHVTFGPRCMQHKHNPNLALLMPS